MADRDDATHLADLHFTEGLAAAADVLRRQADTFRSGFMVSVLGADAATMLGRVMDEAAIAVTKAVRP